MCLECLSNQNAVILMPQACFTRPVSFHVCKDKVALSPCTCCYKNSAECRWLNTLEASYHSLTDCFLPMAIVKAGYWHCWYHRVAVCCQSNELVVCRWQPCSSGAVPFGGTPMAASPPTPTPPARPLQWRPLPSHGCASRKACTDSQTLTHSCCTGLKWCKWAM